MRILIVDDHPLIAEGLLVSLRDLDPQMQPVCAGDREEALAALRTQEEFHLVLLDLSLPDADGLEVLREIRESHPELPVVILSASDQPDTVRAALDAGAMGFISKSSPTPVLIRALQLVLSGGVYIPPQVLAGVPRHPLAPASVRATSPEGPRLSLREVGLTERQVDVLALLVEGKSNKAICRELDISPGTAKTHISAILRALHVENRTQVLFALSQLGVQLPTLRRGRVAA